MNATNTKWVRLAVGIVAATALLGAVSRTLADDNGNPGSLTSKDYKFACAADAGGRMEVDLGRLAVQKAASKDVRDFGQRMVDDHSKAGEGLTKVLKDKGASVPIKDNKKEDKMTAHLQSLSGSAFDAAYIKMMVSDHRKDAKEFEKASEKSEDADLRAWAAKTLPIVQEHLRLAQDIEKSISITTADAR